MRRINQLLYEPPDYRLAEQIKAEIVYLTNLNNLNVLNLWAMFIGFQPSADFYDLKANIHNFHLWLNSEV